MTKSQRFVNRRGAELLAREALTGNPKLATVLQNYSYYE